MFPRAPPAATVVYPLRLLVVAAALLSCGAFAGVTEGDAADPAAADLHARPPRARRRLRRFIHVGKTPQGVVGLDDSAAPGGPASPGGDGTAAVPWEPVRITSESFNDVVRLHAPLLVLVHDPSCDHSAAAFDVVRAVGRRMYDEDVAAGIQRPYAAAGEGAAHAVRRVAYVDASLDVEFANKLGVASAPAIKALVLTVPDDDEKPVPPGGYTGRLNLLAVQYDGPHDDPSAVMEHVRWRGELGVGHDVRLQGEMVAGTYGERWDRMPVRSIIEDGEGLWAFAAGPKVTVVRCMEFRTLCDPMEGEDPFDGDALADTDRTNAEEDDDTPNKQQHNQHNATVEAARALDETAEFLNIAVRHQGDPTIGFVELLTGCAEFLPPDHTYPCPHPSSPLRRAPLPVTMLAGGAPGAEYADGTVHDRHAHGDLGSFVRTVASRPVLVVLDAPGGHDDVWPGAHAQHLVHVALFVEGDGGTWGTEAAALVAALRDVARAHFDRGDTVFVVVPSHRGRVCATFDVTTFPALLVTDARGHDLRRYRMEMAGRRGADPGFGAALARFVADFYDGALPPSAGPFVRSTRVRPGDAAPSSPVRVVRGSTFDAMVMASPNNTLVHFYAPYCGHSAQLAPRLRALAGALAPLAPDHTLDVLKMDASADEVLHPSVDVRAFPTLYLFLKGMKDAPLRYEGQGTSTADLVSWLMDNGLMEWMIGSAKGDDDDGEEERGLATNAVAAEKGTGEEL